MSVLSIILNSKDGFNDLVVVDSVGDFLRSTSWLGAVACTLGTITGQITGFFADRFVCFSFSVPYWSKIQISKKIQANSFDLIGIDYCIFSLVFSLSIRLGQ